jgi:hypothetical protein
MLQKVHLVYNPQNNTSDDKFYNKKMVLWDQNYTALNAPLACLSTIIFGQLKVNLKCGRNFKLDFLR